MLMRYPTPCCKGQLAQGHTKKHFGPFSTNAPKLPTARCVSPGTPKISLTRSSTISTFQPGIQLMQQPPAKFYCLSLPQHGQQWKTSSGSSVTAVHTPADELKPAAAPAAAGRALGHSHVRGCGSKHSPGLQTRPQSPLARLQRLSSSASLPAHQESSRAVKPARAQSLLSRLTGSGGTAPSPLELWWDPQPWATGDEPQLTAPPPAPLHHRLALTFLPAINKPSSPSTSPPHRTCKETNVFESERGGGGERKGHDNTSPLL